MSTTIHDFRIALDNGYSLFAREVTHDPACHGTANLNGRDPSSPQKDGDFLVIVVHGGPGLNSHEESFGGLQKLLQDWTSVSGSSSPSNAAFDRIHALVFYDQLGCGSRSNGPPMVELQSNFAPPSEGTSTSSVNDDLYSLSYYVKELQQVIDSVKLRHNDCGTEGGLRVCLLGHSWGGQVVLEYLLQQAQQSLTDKSSAVMDCVAIVSNAPLNEMTYAQRQRDIRNALPDDVRSFLEQDEQEVANDNTSVGASIYRKLIGISETNIDGEMAGWDALQRIHQISCPCLFITGTKDTIPYEEYEHLQQKNLPNPSSQILILENGEHGPFYGETAPRFFRAIQSFLQTNS